MLGRPVLYSCQFTAMGVLLNLEFLIELWNPEFIQWATRVGMARTIASFENTYTLAVSNAGRRGTTSWR